LREPLAPSIANRNGSAPKVDWLATVFEDLALVGQTVACAREAGAMALDYFRTGARTTATVEFKDGGSPVTEADRKVDAFLRNRLSPLMPAAGWLSEESEDSEDRLARTYVFVVDPIDGTRAFLVGDPRWGISIALVQSGRPLFGVLHFPALEKTYVSARGRGSTLNNVSIMASKRTELEGAIIAGPAGALRKLAGTGVAFRSEPRIPSLAYRLARVADGSLDAGLASTNACDWDIAAADILILEAGGRLTDLYDMDIQYNCRDPRHGPLCCAPDQLRPTLTGAMRDSLGAADLS